MRRVAFALSVMVTAALAGCGYQPGLDDNPLTRRASWFSYVEGGDFREACKPGAPEQYRLVYNGRYTEQIRTYELGQKAPTTLSMRAVDNANLTELRSNDLLAPWRGKAAEVTLTPAQRAKLIDSFADSGMFGKPAVGLELPSDQFYWTAAWCRNGAYGFTGWLHPDEGFQRLSFPKLLQQLDQTGVAFNPPRKIDNVLEMSRPYDRDSAQVLFRLRVGENGLWGTSPLM